MMTEHAAAKFLPSLGDSQTQTPQARALPALWRQKQSEIPWVVPEPSPLHDHQGQASGQDWRHSKGRGHHGTILCCLYLQVCLRNTQLRQHQRLHQQPWVAYCHNHQQEPRTDPPSADAKAAQDNMEILAVTTPLRHMVYRQQ